MTGPATPPAPVPPWPGYAPAGPGQPQHAAQRPAAVAAGLPPELGPERPLPQEVARYPAARRPPAKRRAERAAGSALRIPAVSHLPTRESVARQSRRGLQTVAIVAACVSFAGAGILSWDLWGSSWYTAQQQQHLTAELADTAPLVLPEAPAAPEAPPAPAAPAVPLPAPDPQILIEHVSWETSSPVGRLLIDKIGVDETFVYGTGVPELKKGPGLWKWGVAPGQPGNAMISGHRTTFGAPFHDIDKLAPGDRITVQIPGQTDAVYEVRGTQIVTPQDVQVSDQTGGVRLTLTACHPLGSARERIIVQAELVEGDNVAYALPSELWTFQS